MNNTNKKSKNNKDMVIIFWTISTICSYSCKRRYNKKIKS